MCEAGICQIIKDLYNQFDFLVDSGKLNNSEKEAYHRISADMEDYIAADSLNALSNYLMRYHDRCRYGTDDGGPCKARQNNGAGNKSMKL